MILPYKNKNPDIDPSCFLAPNSTVIGDVKIGKDSSVWFQTVIRGDVNLIRIGDKTNIQDLSMVHVTTTKSPRPAETHIGNHVTIGHKVILHGCNILDHVLIGMGSIVMDHVKVHSHSIVGAGSLVTENTEIPEGVLALGRPAKIIRDLTDAEMQMIDFLAEHYCELAKNYES